jgi:hypothetical protein
MMGMSKKIGGLVTGAALLLISVGANAENPMTGPDHDDTI